MTKDVNFKGIPWNKVVAETEEISGIPRKQIDEVANQLVLGIESVIEKNQPKRDGDGISIETPFAAYEFVRFPETNVQSPEGKTVVRPACIGGNTSIPRRFVLKANIGLVDKPTEEEKKKAKVS
jgi:hypothetical protein